MTLSPQSAPSCRRARRMGPRGKAVLAVALAWLVTAANALAAETRGRTGVTHALLINGGGKPESNFQSHLHHLQDMVAVLEGRGVPRRRIHVFSADGEADAPDLAVRDVLPSGFWLIEETRVGRAVRERTELTDTRWVGVTLHPARKAALRKWFKAAGRDLDPGDRLLIFVTDHGVGNSSDPDNGSIVLWHEELSVREFDNLLAVLRPGVQVVLVMSQCYSGTFAESMNVGGGPQPSGDVCGFFSTARDLRAYGCYPEGRDRDRIGYAFRFLDALGRRATTADSHLEVLLTDSTPDVPLTTRDVFLERILAAEAKARGIDEEVLADRLLADAWLDRAAWEPEIRLLDRIGDSFGTFSPRNLAELGASEATLPPLIERMTTCAERWNTALGAAEEESLAGFVSGHPEWRARLEDKALQRLDAEGRRQIVAELLPEIERHVRDSPDLRDRIEGLRDRADEASEIRWRLEVRSAALRRMRAILLGVAGRTLLRGDANAEDGTAGRGETRSALEGLERCEAFEPGVLPPSRLVTGDPAVDRFPPLADDLELMEAVVPSWLGVRFGPMPKAVAAARKVPSGAEWLEAVFPDSPASEAGLQAGDIVLGPPDRPFTAPGQLREWTMTSPRDKALQLVVLRPAEQAADDRQIYATVVLRPLPNQPPKLPGPPKM